MPHVNVLRARMVDMTLQGKRILIVEDEALIALDLEFEARSMGAIVVTASTTQAAIGIISSTHLDAATVDLKLGRESDLSLAHALAERHIPFIFATALEQRDTPVPYANVPWLQKPFTSQTVRRALDGALSHMR
jgi:CheY-like chemotaxis protein